MARRRGADAALSFFAFQDVMLGVIGIVILLTIVLLLQRATGLITSDDSSNSALVTPVGIPQESPVEIERRVVAPSAGDRAKRRIEIRGLDADLQAAAARLQELRGRIRAQTDRLALGGEAYAVQDELERIETLQEQLVDLQRRRRVTYLLADADGWSPLVIEVSDGRAVVSRPEGRGSAIAIGGATPQDLAERISRYADAERGPREYLLLVVKPSGIATYFELPMQAWDARGVRVGTDLIPESAATTDAFPAVGR